MNVIEAYTKFNGQLVIFITGISGCGKTTLGKVLSHNFKLPLIEQMNYYKKGYDVKAQLPDGSSVVNLFTDDAVDWTALNNDINEKKSTGVIVTGIALPKDKMDMTIDYHIHLSISKKECLERKQQYLKKHKEQYPEEYKLIGTAAEKLKMNQLIFPYYLESVKRSHVNKFLNINELSDDNIYGIAFDNIIEFIVRYLKKTRNAEIEYPEEESSDDSVATDDSANTDSSTDNDSEKDPKKTTLGSATLTESDDSMAISSDDKQPKNAVVRDIDDDETAEYDMSDDIDGSVPDGPVAFLGPVEDDE